MATIPHSIGLTGPVAPLDSADRYPTHFSQYGKGGFYSVTTYADLGRIPQERLGNGEPFIYVIQQNKWYLYLNSMWVEITLNNDESCCTVVDYDDDGDEIVTLGCNLPVSSDWWFDDLNALNNLTFT